MSGNDNGDDNLPHAGGTLIQGSFGADAKAKPETVISRQRYDRICRHEHFDLEETSRSVRCRNCKCDLDAFDLLLDYAQGERLWRTYEDDCKEARALLAKLLDDCTRVRARTKNAARKDALLAVAAERERDAVTRRRTAANARHVVILAQRIERAMRAKPEDKP